MARGGDDANGFLQRICSPERPAWTGCLWICLAAGLVFIGASSLVMAQGGNFLQNHLIPSDQEIANGSASYRRWMSQLPDGGGNTTPTTFKVYLFNITNPEELFQENLEGPPPKPILKEVGPFVYRKETVKGSILWDTHDSTVSYRPTTDFRFVPDESVVPSPDQLWVNLPNLPLISASHYPGHPTEGLFFNTSVDGFLWGQTVPVANRSGNCIAGEIMKVGNCQNQDSGSERDIVNLDYEEREDCVPECIWGLFRGKNASEGHHMEIFTGGKRWTDKGQIKRFNGSEEVGGLFSGTDCSVLSGSVDGFNAFPPIRAGKNDNKNFKVFQSDFCLKLKMASSGKVDQINGIDYLRFMLGDKSSQGSANQTQTRETSDNGFNVTMDADGDCQCVESEEYGCLGSGDGLYFNLGPCQQDWPGLRSGMHGLALTQPHFLGITDNLTKGVVGLKPEPQIHSTYFDLEPGLGIKLASRFRYQLNVVIQKRYWPGFQGDQQVVLPIIWVEEAFDGLSPELTAEIDQATSRPDKAAFRTGSVGLLVGFVLLLVSLGLYCCWKRNHKGTSGGSVPMRPLTSV